ncbi:hypothetical protein HWA77_16950 [Photobacterium damselae subsp. damselae]|uniref:Uncharacterized protein n=1 Tax=Photobacterium damselae subsp. damselae TaxID=85581 RepID=A0A850R0H4_PHODD|nr:hypothetical protein [Photobacterium damselae]NVP01905.1 hypothetical protein [Photobacterium damselae subsp. damselae]
MSTNKKLSNKFNMNSVKLIRFNKTKLDVFLTVKNKCLTVITSIKSKLNTQRITLALLKCVNFLIKVNVLRKYKKVLDAVVIGLVIEAIKQVSVGEYKSAFLLFIFIIIFSSLDENSKE